MQDRSHHSPRKIAHLEPLSPSSAPSTATPKAMKCTLPPHRTSCSFPSYEDYEVHYQQYHVNRCSECGKNFPSELFLNLHIEENHDPLMDEKRKRGEKTYGCFVDGCEKRCSTPQKRRLHLIDKHMFPRKYNFFIVNDGIDRHMSMLRPGGSAPQPSPSLAQPRRISLFSRETTSSSQQQQRKEDRPRRRKLSQALDESPKPTDKSASVSAAPPAVRFPDNKKPGHDGSSGQEQRQHAPPSDAEGVSGGVMTGLEQSMAALRFVPPSVSRRRRRFGEGGEMRNGGG